VTTTLALGSRGLAAHGAIVTRLASVEEMAGMNMLCSDKTGTLTLNQMARRGWEREGRERGARASAPPRPPRPADADTPAAATRLPHRPRQGERR
jgi:magnesium-transporting ATPase (P-type)